MASGIIPVGASESETRSQRIDLQLARAGWTVESRTLIEEFLVANSRLLPAPAGSCSRIGNPLRLFTPAELDDLLGLAQALAA